MLRPSSRGSRVSPGTERAPGPSGPGGTKDEILVSLEPWLWIFPRMPSWPPLPRLLKQSRGLGWMRPLGRQWMWPWAMFPVLGFWGISRPMHCGWQCTPRALPSPPRVPPATPVTLLPLNGGLRSWSQRRWGCFGG